MLLGAFSLPLKEAGASFLSTIFSTDASASNNPNALPFDISNSQNMALLQANTPAIAVSGKQKKEDDEDISKDSSNSNIVSNNALLPATGPSGISDGVDETAVDTNYKQTSLYVARKGDTISEVANMFGVSVETILRANDMKKGEKLSEDSILFILPISGLQHTVTKGQTIQSLAKQYKVNVADIADFNDLSESSALAVGDKLVIPGGQMADEGGDKPAPNLKSAVAKDKNYYASNPIQSVLGYFINPVPTGKKTQGLHGPGNRGIDTGAPTGTPIYASAKGTVIVVKSGCTVGSRICGGGYGNMAIIKHSNGTKTLYAHMSKLDTQKGEQVSRGQVIGYVGSTGISTGPHLHFEVFDAKNPGADGSWAR